MKLAFYRVAAEYCDYLRRYDRCVPYTMEHKARRPFCGVVLTVCGVLYYAPLTSPKPKHLKMKNQQDFIKIKGGQLGAINLNNMIPVPEDCLAPIRISLTAAEGGDYAYQRLLLSQLEWCNSNKDKIVARAEKLRSVIVKGNGRRELTDRCCNFALDETLCKKWTAGER